MISQCKLCNLGVDTEPGLSQTDIARKYGIARSSVQRHLKHIENVLNEPEEETDPFLKSQGIDPATVSVRAYTRRLEDGSYEKVVWKPNQAAIEDALKYDDLEHIFNSPVAKPLPASGELAEIFNMADLQIGKKDMRGGTPETLAAIRVSLQAFADRVSITRPSTIVIADNGDPIENIYNTPSQKHTNDLDVPNQIRTARRMFAEAIRLLTPLAPEIVFVSVPSNHGAFKTDYKAQGGTTDADFGLEINHCLEEIFEGREGYEHVRFLRPKPLEETVALTVAGTRIAFHHGHHTGGPLKHGDWWARQDHGRRPGWDADILVMGHFHTMNVGHSGNGRWIVSCASSDNGSTWYTNKTGETSVAGITTFSVDHGRFPRNIDLL